MDPLLRNRRVFERKKNELETEGRYIATQISMLDYRLKNEDLNQQEQQQCNEWLVEYQKKLAANEEKKIENSRALEALWLHIYKARTR